MPENDCPTCNGIPGDRVRGQQDVFAYVVPVPEDAALSTWPTNAQRAGVDVLDATSALPSEFAFQTPASAEVPVLRGGALLRPSMPPVIHDAILESLAAAEVEYLPRLSAPWFEPPVPMAAGSSWFDPVGASLTAAKFKNKQFPDTARKEIKKRHPGTDDDDIRGDDDGAYLAKQVEDVADKGYDKRVEDEDANPRRKCGGSVIYYIILDELVVEDENDPGHRRIWDWAYLLKQKEAKKLLKDCKSEACDGNDSLTTCRIKLGGELGNWPGDINPDEGEVPEFGFVKVTYSCECLEPLPKEEGPLTGPGKDEKKSDKTGDDKDEKKDEKKSGTDSKGR
jgi:hypothetical protein